MKQIARNFWVLLSILNLSPAFAADDWSIPLPFPSTTDSKQYHLKIELNRNAEKEVFSGNYLREGFAQGFKGSFVTSPNVEIEVIGVTDAVNRRLREWAVAIPADRDSLRPYYVRGVISTSTSPTHPGETRFWLYAFEIHKDESRK